MCKDSCDLHDLTFLKTIQACTLSIERSNKVPVCKWQSVHFGAAQLKTLHGSSIGIQHKANMINLSTLYTFNAGEMAMCSLKCRFETSLTVTERHSRPSKFLVDQTMIQSSKLRRWNTEVAST